MKETFGILYTKNNVGMNGEQISTFICIGIPRVYVANAGW